MKESWYAIYTKSRTEAKVAKRLSNEGIPVFFPTLRTLHQWSDRKKWVEEPLFRSYLFVRANGKVYAKVRSVEGVINFVYHNSKPAIIRDYEIEAIKNFLAKVKHDTVELQPNDEVMVHSGLFSGKTGIIERIDKNHIRLKLDVLQVSIFAEIEKELVRKITA